MVTVVLEAIGLAMALMPIFIELGKHRRYVLDPIALARNPEKHRSLADEFYRDLTYEMSMLQMTIEKFVRDLAISEDVKSKLVNPRNLDHLVWRKPTEEVKDIFELRLGYCTESFLDSMDAIFRELSKLVGDNSLPVPLGADQIRFYEESSYPKLEELLAAPHNVRSRVRFAFNKDKRRKRLDRITKHNERLQKMLLESSDTSTRPKPSHRKSGDSPMPHLRLREKMGEFRKMLARIWCKCTPKHELRLGLFKTWNDSEPVSLDMIVDISDSEHRSWAETKVLIDMKMRAENTSRARFAHGDDSTSTLDFEDVHTSVNISGLTLAESPTSSPTRQYSVDPSRAPSIVISTADDSNSKSRKHTHRTAIKQFCTSVKNNHRQRLKSHLSFENDMIWSMQPTEKQVHSTGDTGISLHSLLQRHKQLKDFKLKHRKILQVLVARSLLFYPWTERCEISKESIHFFGQHEIDLSRPFAPIRPHHDEEEDDDESDFEEECSLSPNETLAQVATLLLELEKGKTIESLRSNDDLGVDGKPTSNTKYFTTMRYVDANMDNMYERIHGALQACLKCDFDLDELSLDSEEFRRKIWEHIVLPLEEELEMAFPKALESVASMQYSTLPSTPLGLGIEVPTKSVRIVVPTGSAPDTPPSTPPKSFTAKTPTTSLPPSPPSATAAALPRSTRTALQVPPMQV